MVAIAMHERIGGISAGAGAVGAVCAKAEKPNGPASTGNAPALLRINRRDTLILEPPVTFQYFSYAVAPSIAAEPLDRAGFSQASL
jgi:hypothetical protein